MIVTLADGTKLECEDQAFAEGGEGLLYWDKAGQYVIKLYKQVEPEREAALQKIIGPDYSVVLNEPHWDELFAWPKAIIKHPALGLTMIRAPKGTMELRWFLGGKQRKVVAAKHGSNKLGTWTNYLAMALRMARVVRRMHFRGLCHSDLSFRNFLVDPPQNRVLLIDCDGLVVPGFLPPNVLGTPLCMAPELMAQKTLPSWQTDLHALAALIYWLLLQRHPLDGPKVHSPDPNIDDTLRFGERALFIEHPKDTSNNIPNLPGPYTTMFTPAVQKLIEKAFIHGLHDPSKRPSAEDWERYLLRMTDSIVPCANKQCFLDGFVLQPHQQTRCPVCHAPLRQFPYLPVLHFYKPRGGRKGLFQNDQHYVLVGWPGRVLQIWHADPTQDPSRANVDRQVKATLEFEQRHSKWYFHNIDLADVRLLDRTKGHQDIHPGKQAEVTDGTRLLLGPPNQCRLAYVQMLKLK